MSNNVSLAVYKGTKYHKKPCGK